MLHFLDISLPLLHIFHDLTQIFILPHSYVVYKPCIVNWSVLLCCNAFVEKLQMHCLHETWTFHLRSPGQCWDFRGQCYIPHKELLGTPQETPHQNPSESWFIYHLLHLLTYLVASYYYISVYLLCHFDLLEQLEHYLTLTAPFAQPLPRHIMGAGWHMKLITVMISWYHMLSDQLDVFAWM